MLTEVGHFSFTVLYDHVLITVPGGRSGQELLAVPVPEDCGRRAKDNCSRLEVGQTVG